MGYAPLPLWAMRCRWVYALVVLHRDISPNDTGYGCDGSYYQRHSRSVYSENLVLFGMPILRGDFANCSEGPRSETREDLTASPKQLCRLLAGREEGLRQSLRYQTLSYLLLLIFPGLRRQNHQVVGRRRPDNR
jgi:hypothetical protein